ncbi:MAG TPA: DUF503 domain-containing protein [Synergistaceae bacterium]|nr:DUF503 domain-containing protein [Synergistaceae bacterium]HQH77433.1 DUF503 domain-containing protein [Synergistaceae bacterium]HQK23995.1 DUF503 domain-containing protein [Synergistaceae bacterium]
MRAVPFFGAGVVEVDVFWSRSLKDRRQVMRSLVDHLRHHWNVSVAELSPEDSWRHGSVAICCAGNSLVAVREKLDALGSYFTHREEEGDFYIMSQRFEVVGYDELSR